MAMQRTGSRGKKLSKLDSNRMTFLENVRSDRLSESTNVKGEDKPIEGENITAIEDANIAYKPLINQTSKLREETRFEETKKDMGRSTMQKRSVSSPTMEPTRTNFKTQNLTERQVSACRRSIVNTRLKKILEKAFIDRFNLFQQTDKDKMIKFFQCVGDPHTTEAEIQETDEARKRYMVIYACNDG